MKQDDMKWLLKDKLVRDFKGFTIGKVKKIWFDENDGPLVVVERDSDRLTSSWEAIPLREIASVQDDVRLKPPIFGE
ncbi:MAG: hypothetical protein BAJATHORv1_40250 [Candidatus Thorarchaeota archaeon]|nr:MAG: hypothetical protein BAJATHORv1_40250 [Candidatus Thorarchaeota archaeon]